MFQNPDLKPGNMIYIAQVDGKPKNKACTYSEDYTIMNAKFDIAF